MKKKHIVSFILAALLIISTLVPMAAFAAQAPGEEALEPQQVISIIRSFVATSSTRATAEVAANSSGDTPYITSEITLQSSPLGVNRYTNVAGVEPNVCTVYETSIYHMCTFPITSDRDYRIKIKLTDEVNGTPVTKTYYEELS